MSPLLRRTLQSLILILVALVPLSFILLPYGIEYGVRQWMLENGEAGAVVGMEDVDFNPLTATLSLYDLELAVDGEMPLKIPELRLPLSVGPLLRRQVEIGAVTIKGVRLLMERPERELSRIGGILMRGADGKPEVQKDAAGRPWSIHIKSLNILDTEIRYQDARIDTLLRIDELELDRLMSYRPEQPAVLMFRGALDGAPFQLDGQLLPFAATPSLEATLNIKKVQLGRYGDALPASIDRLEGIYEMASQFRIEYGQDQVLGLEQQGVASLKQITFEGEPGALTSDALEWDGQLQLSLPMGEGPLVLNLDGNLRLGSLAFDGGEEMLAVEQQSLLWKGRLGYSLEGDSNHGEMDGSLNLEGLNARLPAQQGDVSQDTFAWDGKLEFEQTPDAREAKLTGELSAERFMGRLETFTIDLAMLETPELDLTLRQGNEQGLSIAHNGEIVLQELVVESDQFAFDDRDVIWHGETVLQQPQDGVIAVDVSGKLEGGASTLSLMQQEMNVGYEAISWEGELKLGLEEKLETLQLNGSAGMEFLQVQKTGQEYSLVQLDDLHLEGISVSDPEHVAIQNIDMAQLTVGQAEAKDSDEAVEKQALLQADSVAMTDMTYSPSAGLNITLLQPGSLQAVIYRGKDGSLNLDQLMAALDKGTTQEATSEQANADEPAVSGGEKQFPIRLQEISMVGSNRLRVKDDLPDPPFGMNIDFKHLKLAALDSSQPEVMSPFEITAVADETAQMEFVGGVAPFAPRLGLHLEGKLEGLPLPPLSSYTGKMLGYSLDSGELNADVSLDIEAGQVEGLNELAIHQLEVSPLSAEKMKELKAELSMPLDTALGMLRDKNNTIKLKLPIAGEVDKLQVDPSDAINQAIGRALKKGATTYLTAALFPFGTMLTVAKIAGEEAAKIRLDPIFFEPADAEITDKDREYLAKIVQILGERPEVHIKICGRATESDRERLYANTKEKLEAAAKVKTSKEKVEAAPISDEQLQALAALRASKIEQHMVDNHGIKGNRLISCQAMVEKDKPEARPRTELLL